MLVVAAQPVPGKLHFDAPVAVAIDLFAFGPGHRGNLRPVDARLGQRFGTPFRMFGDKLCRVAIARALLCIGAVFLLAAVLHPVMTHAYRAPALVQVAARMAFQFERQARDQTRVVAFDRCNARIAP
ncbi:hypothetical protein D3C71_1488190 [compost metagenome]